MKTRDATVTDDVTSVISYTFDCHHIWCAFENLEFDCAIHTFVAGFGDDLRAEFASDVCFLLAVEVGLFRAAHPAFD